jgi:RimJ/RimL family protein N-acetyltransferase
MYGINSSEVLNKALTNRLKSQPNKTSMSFVLRDNISNRVAGISHIMKIDENNRQLEIGGTQIGQNFRKTHVNTEAKLLMLKLAFEEFGFVRVYFKIDTENEISQKSIVRLGAIFEGELRNDAILPDGRLRTYRIYSILNSEWPEVKDRLLGFLNSKKEF